MFGRLLMVLVGLLCAVIGVGFLLVGLGFLRETYVFLRTATRSMGKVIAIIEDDNDSSYPVVKFQLPDGEPMRFAGQVGSTPPAYQVGQSVEVLYNPEQPRSARIRSFLELWFVATLFTSMGGLFLLIGGVPLLSQFRPR